MIVEITKVDITKVDSLIVEGWEEGTDELNQAQS